MVRRLALVFGPAILALISGNQQLMVVAAAWMVLGIGVGIWSDYQGTEPGEERDAFIGGTLYLPGLLLVALVVVPLTLGVCGEACQRSSPYQSDWPSRP